MTAAGPGGGDAPPRVPGPTAAPAEVAALTDGEWHRLHPATPLLKGGIALVILLGIVVNNAREFVVGAFVPGERGDGEGDPSATCSATACSSGSCSASSGSSPCSSRCSGCRGG